MSFYCDYNATFPLAEAVKSHFAKGIFLANSSSQHSAGKKTAYLLKECEEFLFNFFRVDSQAFHLVFHSGATEGANHFFHLSRTRPIDSTCMMFSPIDHSCFRTPGMVMEAEGRNIVKLDIHKSGFVDLVKLEEKLSELTLNHKQVYVNTTWVHNELGIVEDLTEWARLKKKFNFIWHIDGTQSIFKIKNYQNLIDGPDMWTFSGHKFGSLMGVGWSFIKKETFSQDMRPFVVGGEQQHGLRAGTLNMEGILSIKWALEDLHPQFNFDQCMQKLLGIKSSLEDVFDNGNRGTIFFSDAKRQACNTLSLAIKNITADVSLPAFDLAGIQLGTGAACASGGIKPQVTLNHLGHRSLANQYLRFSMNPFITEDEVQQITSKIVDVTHKFFIS